MRTTIVAHFMLIYFWVGECWTHSVQRNHTRIFCSLISFYINKPLGGFRFATITTSWFGIVISFLLCLLCVSTKNLLPHFLCPMKFQNDYVSIVYYFIIDLLKLNAQEKIKMRMKMWMSKWTRESWNSLN